MKVPKIFLWVTTRISGVFAPAGPRWGFHSTFVLSHSPRQPELTANRPAAANAQGGVSLPLHRRSGCVTVPSHLTQHLLPLPVYGMHNAPRRVSGWVYLFAIFHAWRASSDNAQHPPTTAPGTRRLYSGSHQAQHSSIQTALSSFSSSVLV